MSGSWDHVLAAPSFVGPPSHSHVCVPWCQVIWPTKSSVVFMFVVYCSQDSQAAKRALSLFPVIDYSQFSSKKRWSCLTEVDILSCSFFDQNCQDMFCEHPWCLCVVISSVCRNSVSDWMCYFLLWHYLLKYLSVVTFFCDKWCVKVHYSLHLW